MSIATGVSVVCDGQCIFELPYPLAHLSDLAMEFFCVGEDESRAVRSNRDTLRRNRHSPGTMPGT